MDFKFMLGVDMSKEWFHICVMNGQHQIVEEYQVDNRLDSIDKFIEELKDRLSLGELSEVHLLLEHTGIYVQFLVKSWLSHGGRLSIVAANKISEHLGLRPGKEEKTDQLDARRIAEYGCRFYDKLEVWQPQEGNLRQLQRLQRQREQLVQYRSSLRQPLKASQRFDEPWLAQQLAANLADTLHSMDEAIRAIEQQIKQLIDQDPDLKVLFKRICSVPGIGLVTATEMLIATNGFRDFAPHQAKSFARYAGCVPQRRQSGNKSRQVRASKQANQRMKKLLTIGARSVMRGQSELGQYYERKRSEGKSHLMVLNALRNKLIHRVFAVVRKEVMYQKNLNLSLGKP